MVKLRVTTLNAGGLQSSGVLSTFLRRVQRMMHTDKVDAVLVQEHNLEPGREGELERVARYRHMLVAASFASEGENGVHWGGAMVLLNEKTWEWPLVDGEREKDVVHEDESAVIVRAEWLGRTMKLGSVYVPCKPRERVEYLADMRTWLTGDMVLGGDWNCVPDVTLDVVSSNPLRYKNIGGELLSDISLGVAALWAALPRWA